MDTEIGTTRPFTGTEYLESLRDGLQSPSVLDPSVDTKVRILHLMDALGIESEDERGFLEDRLEERGENLTDLLEHFFGFSRSILAL